MPTLTLNFVLTDQILAASVMLPIEMWRAAEQANAATAGINGPTDLNIHTVAVEAASVETRSGFDLHPDKTTTTASIANVVYLPALWRNPRPVISRNRALSPWLLEQFSHGSLLAAVGTGCCFLAEAGLLDGKSATTHWHYFDQFQKAYPRVVLKRDYFITQSGGIFCAASVNALADVTVYLIERFYGRQVASHVERNFSHEIRRPYEKYRYFDGDDLQHTDETVIEIQLWLKRHLADEVSMSKLANRFGVSQRSLSRRFQIAIGASPLAYLQSLRIDAAKDLLETTNLTIAEIAYRVGYHDQGHFSRLFQRQMSVKPVAYRKTVRAKVFSAAT